MWLRISCVLPLNTDIEILEIRSLRRRRRRGRSSLVDKDISIKCIVHIIFIGHIFTGLWKINKHFWQIIKNINKLLLLFYPLLYLMLCDSRIKTDMDGINTSFYSSCNRVNAMDNEEIEDELFGHL